jgi:hypothetical protein
MTWKFLETLDHSVVGGRCPRNLADDRDKIHEEISRFFWVLVDSLMVSRKRGQEHLVHEFPFGDEYLLLLWKRSFLVEKLSWLGYSREQCKADLWVFPRN